MSTFDFFIGTFKDSIQQAARWLGSPPKENSIHFNEATGDGYLLMIELENGFFIKLWDYTLHEDTRFHIKPVPADYPVIFTINYLLTPESYRIENGASCPNDRKNIPNNIFLFSNQHAHSFIAKARNRVRSLDICFTNQWLLQQFPASRPSWNIFSREGPERFFLETFSIGNFRIVNEIMEKTLSNDWHIIFLKSRVLTLMDDLLKNISVKGGKDFNRSPANTDTMTEIEKRLGSILHEKLPKLKEIAKEFSLSESTLKRQFRQAYGKPIYEYYLHRKMEMARLMLEKNDKTISQVAYSLGYENASSFIRIFKKQFGLSPGTLRRL